MQAEIIDVNMNNLPDYVRDVFKEKMRDNIFEYKLLHISAIQMIDDEGKVHTEIWDLAFQETGVMRWVEFIKLTYQPWNPWKYHEDNVLVPLETFKEVARKVEE